MVPPGASGDTLRAFGRGAATAGYPSHIPARVRLSTGLLSADPRAVLSALATLSNPIPASSVEVVTALGFFSQDAKVRKAARAALVAAGPPGVAARVQSDTRGYGKLGPAKMPKAVAELAASMQLSPAAFAVAIGEVVTAPLSDTRMIAVKDPVGGAIATLNALAPAELPAFFGRLPAYKELYLDDIKETAPNGLARLQSVQELHLNNWDLKSYNGELRGAVSAHFARIVYFRARNADFLSDLTGLRTLWIENSILPDLKSLTPLVALEDLRLEVVEGFNEWSTVKKPVSLAPLAGMSKLRALELSTARFASLEGIQRLGALEDLLLSHVSAKDLAPLGALPNLRKLRLNRIAATDISVLARVPSLTTLAITGCPDLAPSAQALARPGLEITIG
jgi:hypothetical protein